RVLGQGLAAPTSTPSQQALRREQGLLLAEALERLPADYREVLILHYLERLGHPDVARPMGRSIDSVENLSAPAPRRHPPPRRGPGPPGHGARGSAPGPGHRGLPGRRAGRRAAGPG